MSGCNGVFQMIILLLQDTSSTPHLTCTVTVVSWEKEGTDQIRGTHPEWFQWHSSSQVSTLCNPKDCFLLVLPLMSFLRKALWRKVTWWDRVTTQRCAPWPTWKKVQHKVPEILEWNRSLRKETNSALSHYTLLILQNHQILQWQVLIPTCFQSLFWNNFLQYANRYMRHCVNTKVTVQKIPNN